MACTPTPTATLYATLTTFTTSTSFSQSVASNAQVTTIVVQQTCIASGTISGSSIGCVSSAPVTQATTVGGGGGQTAQVPIIVTIPVTETQPTKTLFAPCTNERTTYTLQTPTQSSTPLTTSILVESTPSPSTLFVPSSATLPDGSVVQTVVTVVTTPPPTSVYVATTSLANPTLQSNSSHGPGSNTAVIVGGVIGGIVGLIAIVAALWWLCRRRRSWDDIFEKEEPQNEDVWAPRRERGRRRLDSTADPKPYQYGLVGHVIPPAAAGEALRMSQYSSASGHSGTHSRGTSLSTAPLLQTAHKGSSRPSTAGSILTVQTQPGQRVLSPVSGTEREPPSLSMASQASGTRPPPDNRTTPALLDGWTPNSDELAILEPLDRTGSPVPATERRVLQIVNDTPSPADSSNSGLGQTSFGRRPSVIMHRDGGRLPEDEMAEAEAAPPAYSR